MNYLVALFADRIQVEEAYTVLEKAGFALGRMAILGKGYKTADEIGLIDPVAQARQQMRMMTLWTVPFGFVAGVGFSLSSGLQTFTPWAGEVGNHLVGGLLGAIAGAMGGAFVGGGVGLAVGGGDALPLRNRLREGKYALVVKDLDPVAMRRAIDQLRSQNPEEVTSYIDPNQV